MDYILFDGHCIRCNRFAKFIEKRRSNESLELVPLNSTLGHTLLAANNFPVDFEDSVVFIKNKKPYLYSTAVLLILKELKKWWVIAYLGFLVPKFIRDYVYKQIASRRKNNNCQIR
jgi:predicted DCC family thiol-disulfide oxidoreductase YuxK